MAKKVWTPAARKAFAAKMKAARAAKRSRRANPGRARVHTKKYDRAVKDIKRSLRKYHRKGNAYAIASASLGEKRSILKRHRRKNAHRAGFVVLAWHTPRKPFYYTGKLLDTRRALAEVFNSYAGATRTAHRIARSVPAGFSVEVKRA
ncbi:MAG: hypothetical protein WBR29_03100 [Gammaproteobacteria bacterium]